MKLFNRKKKPKPYPANLTPEQIAAARRFHRSEGEIGVMVLYSLYVAQTRKLVAAQQELERLKGGGE